MCPSLIFPEEKLNNEARARLSRCGEDQLSVIMVIGPKQLWNAFPRALDRHLTGAINDAPSRKIRELGSTEWQSNVASRRVFAIQARVNFAGHLGAVFLVMDNGMTGGMQCQQSCENAPSPRSLHVAVK